MKKGFTLVELLIVITILIILVVLGIISFQKYIYTAKCNVSKYQHDNVVSIITSTFAMCDVQGWTYLNQPAGTSCRTRNPSLSTNYATRNDPLTEKCIGIWDCSISYCPFGGNDPSCYLPPNAMFYQGAIFYHVRAELNQDNSTIRGDQYLNFESCNSPDPNIDASFSKYSVEGQKRNNWNSMQRNCEQYIGITNIAQNRTDGGIRISTYLGPQCKGDNYKITNFYWPEPYKQSDWPDGWKTIDEATWNQINENSQAPSIPDIETNNQDEEDNSPNDNSNNTDNGYLSTNEVY